MASGDSLLALDPLSNRPPAVDYASVDLRNGFVVLDFDDSTNEKSLFLAILPSQYSGGPVMAVVTWTSSTATTGNVELRVEATRMTSGVNLDSLPSVDGTSDLTVGAPVSSGQLVKSQSASINITGAIAGDLLMVGITRLADAVADTLVGDFELVSLEIREA